MGHPVLTLVSAVPHVSPAASDLGDKSAVPDPVTEVCPPSSPDCPLTENCGIANSDVIVPFVPHENTEACDGNESATPKYDGTAWCVNGKRETVFPHCPRCASYALYRKNNIGDYECQTCGMQGIEESTARRLM